MFLSTLSERFILVKLKEKEVLMIYKDEKTLRYHFSQFYRMGSVLLALVYMFYLIYGSQLCAGETIFKTCNWCGHLNYQMVRKCERCGESSFTDDYFKGEKKPKYVKTLGRCYNDYDLYRDKVEPLESAIYELQYDPSEDIQQLIPHLMWAREYMIRKYSLDKYRKPLDLDAYNYGQ